MPPVFLPEPLPLAVAALIALLVLVGAEIFLRLRYGNLLWIHRYPQVYVPDEDLGYRYAPETEGEIRIAGIHRRFRINKRGFHGPDFAEAKPHGTFRVALIGASNTTGIWMNGKGKNFSQLLEESLRAAGHRVEVMNFGIDGRFRAVHQLRVLDTDVEAYQPDLVLMDIDLPFVTGLFRRDVYRGYVMIYSPETADSRRWCEAWVDIVRRHQLLSVLYKASYVIRAGVRFYAYRYNTALSFVLRVFVENRIQAPDIVVLPFSLKRSVEALQAARDRLAGRGARFAVVQYTSNLYYRQVTAKYGLAYVEVDVPLIPQFVHDRDGHYRHEGHVEIARQLFALLTRSGWLEQGPADRGDEPAAAASGQPAAMAAGNP